MSFSRPISPDPIKVTVGHYTDPVAQTGCTVLLFDAPAPAVVEIRGGATGTREVSLLGEGDLVQSVDAILLTGGSAFGLAAADGVMTWLRDRDRGVRTAAGPVPIVPAAVLYDLTQGDPIWPTFVAGIAACEAAGPLETMPRGQVGAGTGATAGKCLGPGKTTRGGLGYGNRNLGDGFAVHAVSAVNAYGVVGRNPAEDPRLAMLFRLLPSPEPRTATTLTVVIIEAPVDRRALVRRVVAAHDAFARVIHPAHTLVDGDIVFAVGLRTGSTDTNSILAYAAATELAVEESILDAIIA